MRKVLLSLLLCVASILSSFGFEYTDGNGVTWKCEPTTYNGITGAYIYGVSNCPAEVTVPNVVIDGTTEYEVKWVGRPDYSHYNYSPFHSNTTITRVTLPSSVIGICFCAFFECKNLSEINLSACLNIGVEAFYGCSSLTCIGDLSSCTNIGNQAFYDCSSLTSIGDLSACTNIGDQAFHGCSSLTSIGDLSACTNIGIYAFKYCSSLTSIDLSACKSIGDYAFQYCTSLTSLDLLACKNIGSEAFYRCSNLVSVGNLTSCVSIGSFAFSDCTSLRTIGDLSACTIGAGAFRGCVIPKITLGHSVILGNSDYMPECTTFLVPTDAVESYRCADMWKNIASQIISKDAQNEFNVTIDAPPATGSGIKNAIEAQGGDISNVISLNVVGDINAYDIFIMRNQMPNLHFLNLSDANIKKAPNGYCYYGNYTTTNNELGSYAFYQQKKLIDIKLPKTITEIRDYALGECTNLSSIQLYEGLKNIGSGSFSSCSKLKRIVIPNGVLSIGYMAFTECSALRNVSFSNTITSIGDYAFSCCDLAELILPSNLTSIGRNAFYGLYRLEGITLPAALKTIGSEAFRGCSSLKTVKATALDPSSVTIADNSFSDYTHITLYVPYDDVTDWKTTREAYYWNTQWGQFPNKATWKPTYDYITIDGDYDQDKGTIPGESIDADFGNEAGYILGDKDNASQTFDEVHIDKDGDKGGSIISDDTNLTINKLYCDIAVTANKWYFFCFPFDVTLASVEAPGEYVFRLYDGNQRAEGNSGWKNLGSGDSYLKAGKGYIFQTNTSGTLRIPVSNPNFNTAAGGGNAYGKNAQLDTHPAANAQNASWNFIGNPYLSYYELADLGHDAPITYWNGSSYVSVRKGDDDYALQPYQAFFVQKTTTETEVEFDKTKRETYKQSKNKAAHAKAARAKSKVNADRLLLNITISDGDNTDNTRVVFNDKKQMAYETECDAMKFMSSEAVPQIYTTYGDVAYAINERPNGSGEVQLCFKTPKAGTYTIGMSRMDTPMLLKDAETGQVFDFANGSYSFEAEEGTNTTRFLLVKNSSTTAIHPTTVGEAESASFFNLAGQQTTSSAKGVKIVKSAGVAKKVLTK